MSKASRDKGKRGELEVVHLLQAHGWPNAQRTSDGHDQSGRGDLANGPKGWHIDAKRRERIELWEWWAQACRDCGGGQRPLVAFRRSRSSWMALVYLEDLLPLIELDELQERVWALGDGS